MVNKTTRLEIYFPNPPLLRSLNLTKNVQGAYKSLIFSPGSLPPSLTLTHSIFYYISNPPDMADAGATAGVAVGITVAVLIVITWVLSQIIVVIHQAEGRGPCILVPLFY